VVITSKKYLGLSNDFSSYIQGDLTLKDQKIQEILDTIAGKDGKGTSGSAASTASGVAYDFINGGVGAGVVPPSASPVGLLTGLV